MNNSEHTQRVSTGKYLEDVCAISVNGVSKWVIFQKLRSKEEVAKNSKRVRLCSQNSEVCSVKAGN